MTSPWSVCRAARRITWSASTSSSPGRKSTRCGATRISLVQGFGAMADQRRCQLTRYHLQAARPHNAVRACQLLQKFIVIQPPHPHAVFQLGKILVKIARRQCTPGLQIPFIPRIHQPCSQLFPAFFPVFFQNIQRFGGAFPVIHGQLIQALAIVGQARRHRRNAADMLGQRRQVSIAAALSPLSCCARPSEKPASVFTPGPAVDEVSRALAAPSISLGRLSSRAVRIMPTRASSARTGVEARFASCCQLARAFSPLP